ncbi:trans-aconitate 2-methyltransferase [Arthrobacter sp. LAPM80]|uniref:trans-aconitate 2-methyltransferase n=1 Tax=Arthrobacter sp. LAPM80 TaxID=3141788 RepID=UPI00398AA96F
MGDQSFLRDPARYVQFSDFRDRPFFDPTARIGAAPARVVDLGCGPGTLTASLARRWPGAQVLGIDSSEAMITEAETTGRQHEPGLRFAVGDIAGWTPGETVDVVISIAALQWVPGHRELMASWLAALRPGAWLGVQVPGNFGSPAHVLMRELAASQRWRRSLEGVLRHDDAVGEPAQYQELFLRAGARVDVWETSYSQLLQGVNPVLDWVRGTALRPVLAALGPADGGDFEKQYAALVAEAYPAGEFGTVFPFRRIFMVGEKQ